MTVEDDYAFTKMMNINKGIPSSGDDYRIELNGGHIDYESLTSIGNHKNKTGRKERDRT